MIKTRFAPSPTGYLHVGGLRTALYSYLFAKKQSGNFLLRIEDTDRERYVVDGVSNILNSLYWAKVTPDEGVVLSDGMVEDRGEGGPHTQSQRLEIYKEYSQKLLDLGHAYYCFCTSERLEQLRADQQARKMPTGYDGLCVKLNSDEAKQRAEGGEKHVMRLKMEKSGETVLNDLIRGEVRFKNELVDDQVLIKSDGFPTYHFAVVVDDHLMGITHIIRGEEWISSVPKHIQLYKFFGWDVPEMAHLPLLLNPDKSKLSKRQGDVAVEDYRKKGYLPEALVNFVAFLGWNPGTEKEMYTMEELVQDFDLAKVGKTGAVFNIEKLNWFNKQYIMKKNLKDLALMVMPFMEGLISNPQSGKNFSDEDLSFLMLCVDLERARCNTLLEIAQKITYLLLAKEGGELVYSSDLLIWKKSSKEEVVKILPELVAFLENIDSNKWNKQDLETELKAWIAEKGYATGSVMWPMRVSLSGQENSPGPFEIAEVLEKQEVVERLQLALKKLG